MLAEDVLLLFVSLKKVTMKLISQKKKGTLQVIIPPDLVAEYNFEKEVEAELLSIGILLKTKAKPRANWARMFKSESDEDVQPFFLNANDEKEWQW